MIAQAGDAVNDEPDAADEHRAQDQPEKERPVAPECLVTAEEVIGLGSWRDFELRPTDVGLGSAAKKRLTPARGGERRQAASY